MRAKFGQVGKWYSVRSVNQSLFHYKYLLATQCTLIPKFPISTYIIKQPCKWHLHPLLYPQRAELKILVLTFKVQWLELKYLREHLLLRSASFGFEFIAALGIIAIWTEAGYCWTRVSRIASHGIELYCLYGKHTFLISPCFLIYRF